MNRPVRIAFFLIATALAVGIAACTLRVSSYESAFAATADGDAISQVVERFGNPSVRETSSHPFLRYAIKSCETPCVERLWWEHPVLKGIEAWSVEVNTQGEVVHKAHWVSP